MSKRLNEYLENFFEEKDLGIKTYEIDHNGSTHFIESEFMMEVIKKAPYNEKKIIVDTLRRLDFANGDIHHYLEFLAKAYVKHNY